MSAIKQLSDGLHTGFIDRDAVSLDEYQPHLLVNDSSRGHKVLTSLIGELRKCEEFFFSVAFITNSGVASLINTLLELEERGIRGKVIASQYQNFTEPKALMRLLKLSNIELRVVTEGNFHAKGYIFKRGTSYSLIVGSSNLTQNALSMNKEWNVRLSSSDRGSLISSTLDEFDRTFENATKVDDRWISEYSRIYDDSKRYTTPSDDYAPYGQSESAAAEEKVYYINRISPNRMQVEALGSLEILRREGRDKALLISATGTGKTYLSAFDVMKFNPGRFLFLVHRENIARASMKSYRNILGRERSMGILSGYSKDVDADFIFSTVQTMSKDETLRSFARNHFDYIVIDETHRAGAATYQKVMDHFTPKFLLGMTATPERTDGYDIFKSFDYNIAYEIRLNRALEENMLSPFHYYGVSDISVDGNLLDDKADFNRLVCSERVGKVIHFAELYGCDRGRVKGLVFCSRRDEARELSDEFNKRGYRAISLDGDSSEALREDSIRRLEADGTIDELDYIFTVDIFNEGVDIPSVNQIIMLRPTQSAIVFVQQLGRGLRKAGNKEYLTVIDFIGNYSNNYMVPIALYGDNSYNKDNIRKLMKSGSSFIPGASTVNFDVITKGRIFESINTANMSGKKDLVKDYSLLKYKLGRIPAMMDFVEHSSRDPYLYVTYSGSYFAFVTGQEESMKGALGKDEMKLLEVFSKEIANGKRVEEAVALLMLMESDSGRASLESFEREMETRYGYRPSRQTVASVVRNLNFEFITERDGNRMASVSSKYGYSTALLEGREIRLNDFALDKMSNGIFRTHLKDALEYAVHSYGRQFDSKKFVDGFILYRKYSRKDVFRILNWAENPVAQNVGGYIVSGDRTNCPVFVNYHKEESISSTTKYEDHFVSSSVFAWMSKSKRTLDSPDVMAIRNYREGLRIPLFIKKHNDEGSEFYYMGDVRPIDGSFEQDYMADDEKGKKVSVVKMRFALAHPVESGLYEYITGGEA